MLRGRIIRSLSGFYTVDSQGQSIICKARGRFRKESLKPLVGDWCLFNVDDQGQGYIMEIEERKNELVRPPIANIDQALIFVSWKDPDFSSLLLDRFLAVVEDKGIEPIIIVTKIDLADENDDPQKYLSDYEKAGYRIYYLSSQKGIGISDIQNIFQNKVSVLTGQSGVGKSSLLNAISPNLTLQTGEISTALGRGRHTTRHVELFGLLGGWVADTPGFSSLSFNEMKKEDIRDNMIEFNLYKDKCKYRDCMHIKEEDCEIKRLVNEGIILKSRYENYIKFVNEIKSTY